MPITITPLHPLFCAEIAGIDTGEPMDDKTFAEIRADLDEHSVLVFDDQSLLRVRPGNALGAPAGLGACRNYPHRPV